MREIISTITAIVAGALAAAIAVLIFVSGALLLGVSEATPIAITADIILFVTFATVGFFTWRGIHRRWPRGPRAERSVQRWNAKDQYPNRFIRRN